MPVTLISADCKGEVKVEVSKIYSSITLAEHIELREEGRSIYGLPPPITDRYFAEFSNVEGEIRVLVLGGGPLKRSLEGREITFDKVVRSPQVINIPKPAENADGVLVLQRATSEAASANLRVFAIGPRPDWAVAEMKGTVEHTMDFFSRMVDLPDFKVSISPCGERNAVSTPDIVICTELMADLRDKGLLAAWKPILFHELGHTLMNLWGLPGYNNEDMADEFAVLFLQDKTINPLISYFEKLDSVSEAVMQLVNGSRHTISIQRARNMKAAMANRKDIQDRWYKVLEAHKSKRSFFEPREYRDHICRQPAPSATKPEVLVCPSGELKN